MRIIATMMLCAGVAGCAPEPVVSYASNERAAAVAYRAPGPATLTVITVVSNRSGKGAHTAIMINGSQRVIFDPAGSFENVRVAEQQDVLFGVTPAVLAAYKGAHARSTYHVVSQTVTVTPEQAESALNLAFENGAVGQSFCTNAATGLLRQVPGFEGIQQTYYPTNFMEQMSERPGVVEERYYEDDAGTIQDGVANVVL